MGYSKYQVLSCIQPTGEMHLGNYFGAVKNWVDMQAEFNCVYGVVDLHAMTVPYVSEDLKTQTRNMYIDLLSCGIDPEKSVLFVQSLVPEHAELAWYFNCLTSYGELSRQTQFKDKSQKIESDGGEQFISSGLFTYPVLQAADILIYRPKFVPVGKDQQQHLELTRNIAERFNHRFGEYFSLPEPKFTQIPKLMSPADPLKKMSKSLGEKHWVGVFEEEKKQRKKINRAVTDSGEATDGMSPGVANLFELLKATNQMTKHAELMEDYNNGSLMYGHLKKAVADGIIEMTTPFKEKKAELSENPKKVNELMQEGSKKARAIAQETVREVRELVGAPKL